MTHPHVDHWFHIGEVLAIHKVPRHRGLPEFVGDIEGRATHRPDVG